MTLSKNTKQNIKDFSIRVVVIAQAVAILALTLHFSSQALANWHYNTFTKPFVETQAPVEQPSFLVQK